MDKVKDKEPSHELEKPVEFFDKDQRDKEQNFGLKEGGPMDFKSLAQDNGTHPTNLNVDDMEYEDCLISVVDGNFLSKVSDIKNFKLWKCTYS